MTRLRPLFTDMRPIESCAHAATAILTIRRRCIGQRHGVNYDPTITAREFTPTADSHAAHIAEIPVNDWIRAANKM
ncbi:MAG: hypothetical protein WAM90_14810 [Rhodanobacter sp.]